MYSRLDLSPSALTMVCLGGSLTSSMNTFHLLDPILLGSLPLQTLKAQQDLTQIQPVRHQLPIRMLPAQLPPVLRGSMVPRHYFHVVEAQQAIRPQ